MGNPVRVRFAPSPTGYLHVGGLRTALFNYLFARHQGGKFVLRIEDTDQSRKVEGAVENLVETLHWAGIHFDEGPGTDGAFGPYVQSERLAVYQERARQLVEEGNAYFCFCTPQRLDEVRRRQLAMKLSPSYDRHCRNLSAEEAAKRREAGEPSVIRMKMPNDGEMTFDDVIRSKVTIAYKVLDDQVILKSDGFPTYHLAVVVDDHLMQISHVIRGEEWLPSTPKHLVLYKYFGWQPPVYAHLPLLLNPDKTKLSKRQGDVAVDEYRSKGYLKEALVNFVAFLGWNPGDERELFSLDQLIGEFSLERVGKSGAVFNIEKLNWMNAQHLRMKDDREVLVLLKEYLEQHPLNGNKEFADDYLLGVVSAMRERVVFVKDFVEKSPYFFKPPADFDPAVVKKRWKHETPQLLRDYMKALSSVENPFKKEDYELTLRRTVETVKKAPGELIHPLRLAVSGVGSGPGLYDILALLGREETIRRINVALEKLS
ncbi:MAG: glutamate--tRNA ligase [Ignavibacteriales bacterium]|nr:glutamate--tRNA ligase [Ignavibacteriales bacterium]